MFDILITILKMKRPCARTTDLFLGMASDFWLKARKEMGPSVLQLQGTKYCQQPCVISEQGPAPVGHS